VDQFPQIARQIQRSSASIGEDVSSILIGYVELKFVIVILDGTHQIFITTLPINIFDGLWLYHLKSVLRAVPLTTLSKAAMPVSHQLMGTSPGDTFDLEGKVDMLKHTVMTTFVEMIHKSHRILRIAVIAD
jgi:hypothetical protein